MNADYVLFSVVIAAMAIMMFSLAMIVFVQTQVVLYLRRRYPEWWSKNGFLFLFFPQWFVPVDSFKDVFNGEKWVGAGPCVFNTIKQIKEFGINEDERFDRYKSSMYKYVCLFLGTFLACICFFVLWGVLAIILSRK